MKKIIAVFSYIRLNSLSKKIAILSILSIFWSAPCAAQSFSTVPYQFTTGQVYNPGQLMSDFASIINQGNAALSNLQAKISALSPFPAGSIVFFYLQACPSGWVDINPNGGVTGYFIRGLDLGRGQDLLGTASGFGEASSVQTHVHGTTGTWVASTSFMSGVNCTSGCGANTTVVTSLGFTSGQSFTSSVAGTTTAPKNVTLLACEKT